MFNEINGLSDVEENVVASMAIDHVSATLDDELRAHVKLLQLSGNVSLERLLELVDDKLSQNTLFLNSAKADVTNDKERTT